MAFSSEEEQALRALLAAKKITLNQLPAAQQVNDSDLLLTRQDNVHDRSLTTGQLRRSIAQPLIDRSLQKAQNLADVPDKAAARNNLSLYSKIETDQRMLEALPVGTPIPWPTATPPAGWLKCNGWAFDKAKYPRLAQAYPSGTLPDLRGEFIRGWDDGRGVDAGRGVLSGQAQALVNHNHTIAVIEAWTAGAWAQFGTKNDLSGDAIVATDNMASAYFHNEGRYLQERYATNTTGGSENRPRNIAFNYIVRAA